MDTVPSASVFCFRRENFSHHWKVKLSVRFWTCISNIPYHTFIYWFDADSYEFKASQLNRFIVLSFCFSLMLSFICFAQHRLKTWIEIQIFFNILTILWLNLVSEKTKKKWARSLTQLFIHINLIGGYSEDPNTNEHGIAHRRGFTTQNIHPIPDLRSGLNSPPSSAGLHGRPPFQGQYGLDLCIGFEHFNIDFIHIFPYNLSVISSPEFQDEIFRVHATS